MKVTCPSCLAALVFDAQSGKMECKYCGCQFDLKDIADQEVKEAENASTTVSTDTMQCDIYACTSCGAELSVNGVEAATFCAYCGQPTIVFSRVSQELKPKWIIPFKVPKEDAINTIRARFRQGWFIPNEVKNFSVERVSGIYVPYWLLDTYYHDSQVIRGVVGSGKHRKVKYYRRVADCEFQRLTLDASSKLNDESSQRLEPFETKGMRAFEVAYMSGYYADRFDQNAKNLRECAIKRTKELFDGQMLASVGAREKRIESSNPQFEMRKEEYALFPVWFMTFRYGDKPYTMLVNGQTGKLVGAVPYDKTKMVAVLIGIFLIAAMLLVPVCAGLLALMSGDEDFIKVVIALLLGVFFMGKHGYKKYRQIQLNESLSADARISQYAHNRQSQ